ncbi:MULTISPECIES: ATP-grasp domain-containing protein [Rhodococcus]|nr:MULTISPECIES: ATP-grasp domain-containing protein [Rhodococcus]MDV7245236.1 ATP-grasp domain-containing protein [Rhodococcus oxybenzonivorans]MDV7272484.1 ATP-grasp domain-containing protein [Rhodococcus oxybenzonivorans]MDV7336261.1 ATP-grasp domain-containing protein [Rhodococcus oxybenzonivorans]MDV7342946.1 ATP-grasp domain-containing protein [Rhodococcus oxybenzonivorans]MDV8025490.1 ATP-grasp domain-containing protein [Rhodococcus sp. IEGM 27]
MSEHVLVVGSGRDLPSRVRSALPGTQTSVICRLDFVAKLRQLTEHARVIAVRHDAPDEEWIALARAAHARHPFTRIATFGERDQDRCAAIGEALGLSTHSRRTVALIHDKDAMREQLRDSGIDSTPSAVVADVDALHTFVAKHGLPCVVKPVCGAGSAGVAVAREEAALAAAFMRAGGSFDGLPNSGVLVEQFHEGPQFSVEAFSESSEHQVVAITRKFSDPATFVELGHVAPAELSAAEEEQVHTYVGRLLDALGVEFGATHTEIVLGSQGPKVIETHVRMGGDEIPALAFDATGVDLADCVVRQTVGEKVLPGIRAVLAEERPGRCSAIWFAAAPVAGVLTEVGGLDDARNVDGVTEVQLLVLPGSRVEVLESSDSRVAYARALGDTAVQALVAAREAVGCLEFQVRVAAANVVSV